jgi:hypothetical protein
MAQNKQEFSQIEQILTVEQNKLYIEQIFIDAILDETIVKGLINREHFLNSFKEKSKKLDYPEIDNLMDRYQMICKMKTTDKKLMETNKQVLEDMTHYMVLIRTLLEELQEHGIDKEKILKKTEENIKKIPEIGKALNEEREKIDAYIR